jgi:fructokinase
MQRIREAGGFVSFDPNIRTDLWQDPQMLQRCLERAFALADVVKLSEEELAFMTASTDLRIAMKTLAERFAIKLLLVTQGKAGVQALFQGDIFHYPSEPVSVDTTGAGDAFVAGLCGNWRKQVYPKASQIWHWALSMRSDAVHWRPRRKGR